MTKQTNLYITQAIKNPAASILPADTTTTKVVYTASANDAVMKALMLASSDTAAQNVQVILNDGTTDRVLGTVPVAIGAGTNGTAPAIDALSGSWLPGLPSDQNGKRILPLAAGQIVKVKSLVTITAAKQIDAVGIVEEY